MNTYLKPTLHTVVGKDYVLWFQASHKYIVINSNLNELITFFLTSNSINSFKKKLLNAMDYSEEECLQLYKDIKTFLKECHNQKESLDFKKTDYNISYRNLSQTYKVNQLIFEIHYSSEKLKNIIHPQLEHIEIQEPNAPITSVFDIYKEDDQLLLFKDYNFIGNYSVNNYHLLQGKFAMELLCSINENNESDWLGTFHASTVKKNNKGIMLIGDSGSGKSTFTALMMSNGFNLVADDISPILANDLKVYPYPAGVSIKSGAFKTLNTIIPDFKLLKEVYVNPYKGYVKYIPSRNTDYIKQGTDSNTLIHINYKPNSKTIIEPFDLNEALQILIPESWLESSKTNAKRFMEWLKQLNCYKLTYSNYKEAINLVSELIE
ncbi:MAG: hypothetical protein KJN82_04920 [Bacteroidia bacterium]|nr:hypothetical protein [Bacteroidia bacterium]